jgi:hypothetical protein
LFFFFFLGVWGLAVKAPACTTCIWRHVVRISVVGRRAWCAVVLMALGGVQLMLV